MITGGGVGAGTNTPIDCAATMGLSRGVGVDVVIAILRMVESIGVIGLQGH